MSPGDLTTTPFNRHATADGVIAGIDLTQHRVIVTGASSGIEEGSATSVFVATSAPLAEVVDHQIGQETQHGVAAVELINQ